MTGVLLDLVLPTQLRAASGESIEEEFCSALGEGDRTTSQASSCKLSDEGRCVGTTPELLIPNWLLLMTFARFMTLSSFVAQ